MAGLGLPDAAGTNTFNAAYLMLTGSINFATATYFGDIKTGNVIPTGTPENRDFAEDNYNLYFLDSWKLKPNVTVYRRPSVGIPVSHLGSEWKRGGAHDGCLPMVFNPRGECRQRDRSTGLTTVELGSRWES